MIKWPLESVSTIPDNKHVFKTLYNHFHIDEKWFYVMKENPTFYFAPTQVPPYAQRKYKGAIVKIFFCGQSPIQDIMTIKKYFDGKLAYVISYLKIEQ